VSLSTTTARFIGTFNALDGEPVITCRVSAGAIAGAAVRARVSPARAALIGILNVM